jgi:hypothetical protein
MHAHAERGHDHHANRAASRLIVPTLCVTIVRGKSVIAEGCLEQPSTLDLSAFVEQSSFA